MNYEIIIILLGISSGMSILTNQSFYDNLLIRLNLYFKPFVCTLCMTFWTSLIYLLITNELSFISILSLSFINSYIGEMLSRKLMMMI